MFKSLTNIWDLILGAYSGLNQRERQLIIFTAICGAFAAVYLGSTAVYEYVDSNNRMVTKRNIDLQDFAKLAQRYSELNNRLDSVQATFAESQLTFEEVTKELDRIIRSSTQKETYDLKKGQAPDRLGFEYEKQEYTLKMDRINLEQLVRLLHQLEQGTRPLFLGKVEVLRSKSDGSLNAALEIFSIRKSSPTVS